MTVKQRIVEKNLKHFKLFVSILQSFILKNISLKIRRPNQYIYLHLQKAHNKVKRRLNKPLSMMLTLHKVCQNRNSCNGINLGLNKMKPKRYKFKIR